MSDNGSGAQIADAGIVPEAPHDDAKTQATGDPFDRSDEESKRAERALKNTFGAYPTGVTVVTTMSADGPRGFTANSFTSVSLDPPLLLVCHSDRATSHAVFASTPGFAVNVLSADQEELAMRFASKVSDRFAGIGWSAGQGGPLLDGASAWLDCSMQRIVPAGDHSILIGRVRAHGSDGSPPLAYWRGAFRTDFSEG